MLLSLARTNKTRRVREPKISSYRADEGKDWEMDLKANWHVTDTGSKDIEWPKWEWEWNKVDRSSPSTQSLRSSFHHQYMEGLFSWTTDVMAAIYR